MTFATVRRYRLAPSDNGVKFYSGRTAGVKIESGAWPGAKIHWEDPGAPPYDSADAAPLVNGAFYEPPKEDHQGFWITFPATVATSPGELCFKAFSCATPVVVLNPMESSAARCKLVGSGNVPTIEFGTGTALQTVYTDNINTGTTLDEVNKTAYVDRGFVGGGVTATVGPLSSSISLTAALWQRVIPGSNAANAWAEAARWELGAVDRTTTRASCIFEVGGTICWRFNSTFVRMGQERIPWPAFGAKLTLEAIGASAVFTDVQWCLYERYML